MVCRSNWIPTRDAMVSCSVAATSKRWWSDPWNLLELSHFCRWCISEELGGRSWEYQWHPRSCPQQKVLYTRSLKGMKPNSGIAYIYMNLIWLITSFSFCFWCAGWDRGWAETDTHPTRWLSKPLRQAGECYGAGWYITVARCHEWWMQKIHRWKTQMRDDRKWLYRFLPLRPSFSCTLRKYVSDVGPHGRAQD